MKYWNASCSTSPCSDSLKRIGMVESKRTINGTTSTEYRYYLLNLENNVHKFAESVRNHWSIENQLHWVLDVGFNEDNSQCY
ncbi:MAG: ISAs1 family transposase [Synechococcales bacterium]|nr:ISAs1 family transposase [Synechococcales bacterium]